MLPKMMLAPDVAATLDRVGAYGSTVETRSAVSAQRLAAHRDTAAPVPQPMAITCVVVNDPAARTLYVRLGDTVTGSARIAWQNGYQAFRRFEDSGYSLNMPDLWGSTKTADRVAHAQSAEGVQLKFHFEPGNTAYSELVSRPKLYAIAAVDRQRDCFLSCKFLHRP